MQEAVPEMRTPKFSAPLMERETDEKNEEGNSRFRRKPSHDPPPRRRQMSLHQLLPDLLIPSRSMQTRQPSLLKHRLGRRRCFPCLCSGRVGLGFGSGRFRVLWEGEGRERESA